MKPMTETDRQAYSIVEAALQSYPRFQAPSHFAAEVMAHVRAKQSPMMHPKFQFPWLELLIGMILTVTMGTVWLVWRILPPVYLVQLRMQGQILWQQVELLRQDEMLAWLIPLALLLVLLSLAGAIFGLTSSREWQS